MTPDWTAREDRHMAEYLGMGPDDVRGDEMEDDDQSFWDDQVLVCLACGEEMDADGLCYDCLNAETDALESRLDHMEGDDA